MRNFKLDWSRNPYSPRFLRCPYAAARSFVQQVVQGSILTDVFAIKLISHRVNVVMYVGTKLPRYLWCHSGPGLTKD